MTVDQFQSTLTADTPPAGLAPALLALWHDGKGDWNAAHDALQDDHSAAGAWVHAFLHREEGDVSNAAYWYRRAGQPVAQGSLEDEWVSLVRALLPV